MAVERTRRLALLLAAPALLAAAWTITLETWRALDPEAIAFAPPPVSSLAEAIERNDAHAAHALLQRGADPLAHIRVSDPRLTGGRTVDLVPLVWAAARQSDHVVGVMLSHGGVSPLAADQALCVAEAVGNGAVAATLRPYAQGADDSRRKTSAGVAGCLLPRAAAPE